MRSFYPLFLLPATIYAAGTIDCEHIRADGKSFQLSALKGRKSVNFQESTPPSITNTTFTVDICAPLQKLPGIPSNEQCEGGTRICGIKRIFENGINITQQVIPIAGDYSTSNGRHLDAKFTRLKDGESHEDAEREGLRAELHGGMYETVPQMAYIEFLCDKDWTGNEGFEEESKIESIARREEPEDGGDEEIDLPDLDKGKAISFVGYKMEGDAKVLRMTWKTKFACEDAVEDSPSGGTKAGWGFFTWLLIIVFLLVAAYIIFGSWLNYNRYGARGWDLLPHGDTIRDLPYIVKDLATGMMDKMRGGGGGGISRGGYSAV